jgi:hypothetical protein
MSITDACTIVKSVAGSDFYGQVTVNFKAGEVSTVDMRQTFIEVPASLK